MMKLLVSTAPEKDADGIASALLELRLVACVSFVRGVRSRYWWKGKLEEADEVVMFMKTTDELAEGAVRRLVELHPYEVPEAVLVDLEGGWRPYLDWIAEVTGPEDASPGPPRPSAASEQAGDSPS